MKKELLIVLCAIICVAVNAQQSSNRVSIIPQPVSVVMGTGSFNLPADLTIVTGNNEEVKRIAGSLSKTITTATGIHVAIKEGSGSTSKSIFYRCHQINLFPKKVIV